MKHQTAPKWLLTTALLAVLGANYSFQANSLALAEANGSIELASSNEPATPATAAEETPAERVTTAATAKDSKPTGTAAAATPAARVTTAAPAKDSKPTGTAAAATPAERVTTAAPAQDSKPTGTAAAATPAERVTTPDAATPAAATTTDKTGKRVDLEREGKVLATGICADGPCKSVVLEMSAIDKFATGLAAAIKASAAAPTTATTLPAATPALARADESEYDCDFTEDGKPETRAQKRDRLRCEKAEKERVKREDRIAKFEDRMESVKDRCEVTSSESKLECLTRGFNDALGRYTGRNAVPANVVQRYFKSVVGGELSKMLFNNEIDAQTAMSMLHNVFDGLPSEYGVIRQNVLQAVQNETKNRSAAINQQYKLADSFAKQNKPQEYLQAMGDAQAAQAELTQMVDVYSAAARTSDSFSGDVSFAKYYQQTYLPAMRQIFSLMGPAAASASTPEKTEQGGGTRTNTRGGTTGSGSTAAPATRGQATTIGGKVDGSPTQWEFLNSSSTGFRVGAPSQTSRGNTRGARSMGN